MNFALCESGFVCNWIIEFTHVTIFSARTSKASPAQAFEVATEIFRTLVPPLQSITLAIDSNWGHDFACLYRFRVHGELVEQ